MEQPATVDELALGMLKTPQCTLQLWTKLSTAPINSRLFELPVTAIYSASIYCDPRRVTTLDWMVIGISKSPHIFKRDGILTR